MKKVKNIEPFIGFRKITGRNLRALRKKHKCDQIKTASIMKISQPSISRFENGDFTISLEHIVNLSNGLKIPVSKVANFLCKVES